MRSGHPVTHRIALHPNFHVAHSKLASPECTDSDGRHRLGKMVKKCEHCKALFWAEEKVRVGTPLQMRHRMHSAQRISFCGTVLPWLAHIASTTRLSMLMLPHDLSVCICALQLKSSAARPRFGMCCRHGKVKLPPPRQLPQPLLDLLRERDPHSQEFLAHTRAYNSAFQLASHVYDDPDAGHRGQRRPALPSSFRIQGRPAHLLGLLLPDAGKEPAFAQIYCSDPDYDAQVVRRMRVTGTREGRLMRRLQDMLYECNPWVQTFSRAAQLDVPDLRLVLHDKKGW